jgi:hypothetical protein
MRVDCVALQTRCFGQRADEQARIAAHVQVVTRASRQLSPGERVPEQVVLAEWVAQLCLEQSIE